MGRIFIETGDYWGKRKRFSAPHFTAHLEQLIDSPMAGFFVSENSQGRLAGAFAAIVTDDIFSGNPVLMKLHWLAVPDGHSCGLHLLRHVLRWARSCGATECFISAINDNSARILERLGFAESERLFHKAL